MDARGNIYRAPESDIPAEDRERFDTAVKKGEAARALEAELASAEHENKWIGEPHMGNQKGCARCGADEHLGLTYLPFTYPIDMGDGFTATHYVPCPTNGEPILLCQGTEAAS